MPHLVLVTTSYPEDGEGQAAAGTFVADFARELAQRVRVSVVAPALQASETQESQQLTVHRFAVPRLPLSLLSPGQLRDWSAILRTLRAGQGVVERICAQGTVDHILALWVLPSGYWARRTSRRYRIPYSTWALGSDIWSLGKIPLVSRLLAVVLQDSHSCFADGYQLQDDVEQIGGRSCQFLPSARRLNPSRNKRLAVAPPYKLAFLGRWHPNKGADLLLESLWLLDDQDWARITEIRIHGGGPLEAVLSQGCKALQTAGRPVKLGGYLDKAKAAELLYWADYLLLPSRLESIPVVFSDAMQCLCPVVSMPVGDLPRLLTTNKVGTLAKSVSAPAFAQALHEILQQPPVTFKEQLQQVAEVFRIEHSVEYCLGALGIGNRNTTA